MSVPDVKYFSIRRFGPYQGTAQVVQCEGFRAISADGITWRVQVQHPEARYITQAIWRRDGQSTLTENKFTAPLIAAMNDSPPLPLPMADTLELWLLDASAGQPLAIVTSALPRKRVPAVESVNWSAFLPGDHDFCSADFQKIMSGEKNNTVPMDHGEILRRYINVAAGSMSRAQWFQRDHEGNGKGLAGLRLKTGEQGRFLTADCFPELLVSECCWQNKAEQVLVKDYHHWHAANLLSQNNLAVDIRERLERAACTEAFKLYERRHILPTMLNLERVKVAFVQAKIALANRATAKVAG